jgi:3-deoxy-D-manno-octulosonate 8-phosphate phosphatase (KDO 8-P phosphatase)
MAWTIAAPDAVRERAARVRLVAFDVDGTLTDGRLWFDAEGRDSKAFHAQDGLGMRMLEDSGIAVAWITARDSASARMRALDLRISHIHTGVHDKLACLRELCATLGVAATEVAYMGDDLNDLCLFGEVGLAVSPANGHALVRERAQWTTLARGGEGAARELCDLVLQARGLDEAALARYTHG